MVQSCRALLCSCLMLIKQLSFSGTTSDWRGRNVIFCCKGSTCLPPFLLLLYLSHQYRYAPLLQHCGLALNISTTCLKVQQDKQWTRGSLQLRPNTPILCSLPAQGCQLRGNCSLSRHLHILRPLCLLSPAPALPVSHLSMCFWPHKSMHTNVLLLLAPFPVHHLPGGLTIGKLTKINAVSANSPATKKVAMASIMGTYTVPKMLVFHLTSGWRRCGGRGQIRNRFVWFVSHCVDV